MNISFLPFPAFSPCGRAAEGGANPPGGQAEDGSERNECTRAPADANYAPFDPSPDAKPTPVPLSSAPLSPSPFPSFSPSLPLPSGAIFKFQITSATEITRSKESPVVPRSVRLSRGRGTGSERGERRRGKRIQRFPAGTSRIGFVRSLIPRASLGIIRLADALA